MKPGMVTQIRINPGDCQAILDVLERCAINPYDGRSFAQCTSMALSALIGMARKAGAIPEIDEFQYLNRMQHFLGGQNSKKRVKMAQNMLYDQVRGRKVELALPGSLEVTPPAQRADAPGDAGQRRGPQPCDTLDEAARQELAAEYIELNERLNDGQQLSDVEQRRYDFLNKVLF